MRGGRLAAAGVNGLHDLAGMHGFGPVPIEADEPVFHASWERSIFAVMLALAGQGLFNTDAFRWARESIHPSRYLSCRYFELWLHAVEQLLAGVLDPAEIAARTEELRHGAAAVHRGSGDSGLADRLNRLLWEGASTAGAARTRRRFGVGAEVRSRNTHPDGHTRLPMYARDKRGFVEAAYPAFPLPDHQAHAPDPRTEHVYCVRFDAEELWGDSAEPGCAVHLDMWESYLESAATVSSEATEEG